MNPGDVIAERYEVDREAGSGGMGTVYRALDRVAGGAVAIKVLHGAGRVDADRFAREASTLAELSHPGIVRFVGSGTTPRGERFLAMEWLDGEDLGARLARGRLRLAETLALGARVADALGVAHRRGFVHRDLKPSNLFLAGGAVDAVKVLDFGIARRVSEQRGLTGTGVVVGTPEYMSPEQARGVKNIDARADVFSLGCVLFECLTGEAPFVGESLMAVLAKILMEDPPRLHEIRPDLPESVSALIERMMSRDPSGRPADGTECAALLTALAESAPAETDDAVASASGARPRSVPPAGLTSSEQRVVCVVLARGESPHNPDAMAATAVVDAPTAEFDQIVAAVHASGARVAPMADGSMIVVLSGAESATDLARRGARCALAVRRLRPGVPVVLATGRGVVSARMPVGDVIDRAVRLMAAAGTGAQGVRIDEATAGLIDARFDVGGDGAGLYVRGERPVVEAARTLLGAPTACVGRDRELGNLESVLAECVNEPVARAVLVTAVAGAGKSRLASELVKRAARREGGLEVFAAGGDPVAAGSPFGLLGSALRDAAGVIEGEPAGVQRRKLRARVARHVPESDVARVSEFLAELCRIPAAGEPSDAVRSARADAQSMNDSMLTAWDDFLAAECDAGPVLLLLDDLHWGDLSTVQFVDAALRNLADKPLMVLALARPDVHQTFPGLWNARDVLEVRLAPLTKKAAEKLVRNALGARVTDADVGVLLERAEGNPFYLEELVRAVAAGTGTSALPDSVLAMLQQRLDALGDEARRVLRAASVFGQTFWRGGVMRLLGSEHKTTGVVEWLHELVAREVIARGAGATLLGETEYVFRNVLLRDAAYAMLTEQDRVLGHRLAAEWLEKAGESSARVLAEHFDRGRCPERAMEFYRAAAEQALEGNDFDTAIALAARGIELGASGDALGMLLVLQAEAHAWRGQQETSCEVAERAAECFSPGSAPWFRAMTEVVLARWKLSEPSRVDAAIERAMTAPALPEAAAARLGFLLRAVPAVTISTQYDLAARMDEQMKTLAPLATDVRTISLLKAYHANRALFRDGDPINGLVAEEEAIGALQAAGDLRSASLRMANTGYIYCVMTDYDSAESMLRLAVANASRLGLEYVRAVAEHNLGYVFALRGQVDAGRAMIERAAAALGAQKAKRLEAGAYVYLANISAMQGQWEQSEREARHALELAGAVPIVWIDATTAIARVQLAAGRFAEALETASGPMAMLPGLRVMALVRNESAVISARALDALGRGDEARRLVREQWAEIVRIAGRMSIPWFRETALRRLPTSIALRELGTQWGLALDEG